MNDFRERKLSGSAKSEEARIKAAYARRHEDPTRYSYFSPGHLFLIQERERQVLGLLRETQLHPLAGKKILEIGCGTGQWLREFIKWGAEPENITGIDLLPDRVARAKRLCAEGVRVEVGSATELEFQSGSFDLVLQSTVFTSILDAGTKQTIASEMLRVAKDDGVLMWYDYHVNNPRNPDVRGVKRKEIEKLFPDCRIKLRHITLAPPLARQVAPRSWLAAFLLEKIPLLCTHYIGVIRKIK